MAIQRRAIATLAATLGLTAAVAVPNAGIVHAAHVQIPRPHSDCGGSAYLTWMNQTVGFQDAQGNPTGTSAVYNIRYGYRYDSFCHEFPVEVDLQQVSGNIYDWTYGPADASVAPLSTGTVFDTAGHDCDGLPHASTGQWKVLYFNQNQVPSSPYNLFLFFRDSPGCGGNEGFGGAGPIN